MSWLAGWEYRIKLTISHANVDSDLTWFPILVKISTSSGLGSTDISRVFDELGTNSLKIAVTQSDGYTEQYVEIEKWDSVGEEAILWVSKTGWVIAGDSDTVMYLYYDSTHANNSTYVGVTNSAVSENVWDANFMAIYHMADGVDTSHIYDSTGNDRDGTKKDADEPNEVTGQIGDAQDFDGNDDLMTATNYALPQQTIEALFKIDATPVGSLDAIVSRTKEFLYVQTTGKLGSGFYVSGHRTLVGTTAVDDAAYHYGVFTYDGTNGKLYTDDGAAEDTINDAGSLHNYNTNWIVGAREGPAYFFPGLIDEVRISNIGRSEAWVKATKKSLWDDLVTYSIEQTISPAYKIEIDWDKDGDFYDTDEDVSSNVKTVHFSRGKSDELGKAEVGQCSITLNNANGLYTPSNSGGDLYGALLPKRPIQTYAIYNGNKYDLFYGFIEEIIPHPHKTEQDCIITAVDGMDFLSRHDMATALYKDALTGTIHGYILDDAGWSATMRTLDTGQDTVPYWYGHDVKARFAQEEIDDSEQGFSYVGGSGYFYFEDRHHRSTSTHQTSQATFNNTMADMTYSLSPRNVYNIIKVTVTPWELQSITELWRLDETPIIPAGETYTYWGNASVSGQPVFVDTWATLNDGDTDYTASGTVSVSQTNFAQAIKIVIENTDTVPVTITLLKARGTYYDNLTKVTLKAEDSTSQTAYQKRTFELDGKYMTDSDKARDYVTYAIGKYKDPRAELSMSAMNQDTTILAKILALEISDRITVVNDELGLNDDYFIDHMEHDISMSGKLHTVSYRLSDTINEDFWCLDYSALASVTTSGQTKLGY